MLSEPGLSSVPRVTPEPGRPWFARLPPGFGAGWVLASLGMALVFPPAARAQPYTPRSDDEVLERLPPGPRSADLRRQREELAADADNLRESLDLARSYLETARVEGDARYAGYAHAVLGPWWDQAGPPAGVLAARGTLRAMAWEYDRALVDFRAALALDATELSAWQGALEACLARSEGAEATRLMSRWPPDLGRLERATAQARLRRSTGAAREARDGLLREYGNADGSGARAQARFGALLLLADLALQLGDPSTAEGHFRAIAGMGHRDVAGLLARADAWLDQGRPEEVVGLLKDEPPLDPVVVRLGEAWSKVPARDRDEADRRRTALNQLEQRLEARRRRDDATSIPDDLRFRLRVRPSPARALERAGDLWAVRREFADVRWILEAARVGNGAALAGQVEAWLREHRWEDVRWAAWRSASAEQGGRP